MEPPQEDLSDLLWAWGGHDAPAPRRPSFGVWASAAALLLAVGLAWRWPPRPAGTLSSAVPALAPVAATLACRSGDRVRGFYPGRGVEMVLDAHGAVHAAWEDQGSLLLEGLSGGLWLDLPAGITARVILAGGTARATGAAFSVTAREPAATAEGGWLREAGAGEGGSILLAVSRGKVAWTSVEGKVSVSEGEVLDIAPGAPPRLTRDPIVAGQSLAFHTVWSGRAWTPILPGDLEGSEALQIAGDALRAASPKAGMARIRPRGLSLPSHYEMEVRLRRLRADGGAGLVYEAGGRRPICMLAGDGWHTLGVLVAPSGVELRVDGVLAQALPAPRVAGAATLETGLEGAGVAYWETGVEVSLWRWRALE